MKQLLLFTTLLLAALFTKAVAQDTSSFTQDGVVLPVNNTGNNTLIEIK